MPEDDIPVRIQRILTKLQQVRTRKTGSFGSESHRYCLKPPLAESVLIAWEMDHGVTLPEAFRQFILTAGDGGAGPAYGLYPFSDWSLHCRRQLELDNPLRSDDREHREFITDDPELHASEYFRQGAVEILSEGCSYGILIIVRGPLRGRIVRINDDVNAVPYVTADPDFLAWYERWLDHLLWKWDDTWAGLGLPGTAGAMLEVLTNPSAAMDVRREALRTVLRMPSLSDDLAAAVAAQLKAPNAEVRELALLISGRYRLTAACAWLPDLFWDIKPQVRSAAVRTCAAIAAPGWEAEVRPLLQDPEHDVFFNALCVLKDAKALHRADLEPLIASPESRIRSSAIWAWGQCGLRVSTAPWFSDRVRDPDPEVRRQVILSCADTHDHAILPHLEKLRIGGGADFNTLVENVRRRLSTRPPQTAPWERRTPPGG